MKRGTKRSKEEMRIKIINIRERRGGRIIKIMPTRE